MFDGDTNIGLQRIAQRNQFVANRNARQSNLNLDAMEKWRAHAKTLEQEVASLRAHIADLEAVRAAEDEARGVELAAWRKQHPVSHMHDVMGRFRDGVSIRRNISIWMEAFDAAARRLGIRNPEAWRIS